MAPSSTRRPDKRVHPNTGKAARGASARSGRAPHLGTLPRGLLHFATMTDTGAVSRSLDRTLLFKLILLALLYALFPLAEVFLFLYLGNLLGNYLLLVLTVVAGVPGAFIALDQARRGVAHLRQRLSEGRDTARELGELAALLVAAVCLITPGFLTDIVGYVLLVPGIRRSVSRRFARLVEKHDKEIYDRLRLSSL